jgi:two-component system response regulator YesN
MTLLDSGMYGKALDTIKDFFYNPKVMPVVNSSFLENYKFQFLDSLRNLSLARRGDVNILQGLPAQAVSEGARTVNDFIDLAESVCEQLEQLNQAVPDSMPKSMVEIVKSHIMDRLAQNLSRNSIAEYFYLSPDYLDRIFKKALGQTVTDYIFVQRILLSQQLLTGSCLSVSEIASKAGFPSLSHFSNAFKRYTGCSPLAYRKKQAAKG